MCCVHNSLFFLRLCLFLLLRFFGRSDSERDRGGNILHATSVRSLSEGRKVANLIPRSNANEGYKTTRRERGHVRTTQHTALMLSLLFAQFEEMNFRETRGPKGLRGETDFLNSPNLCILQYTRPPWGEENLPLRSTPHSRRERD